VRDEANALFNAAQLAVFDHADRNFLLLPRDSGATPQSAEAAARGLMEQGADLILGPLFANQAAAVMAQARNGAAPVLSFSNDRSAAGQGVYVMGLAIEDEVARIVDFTNRRGVTSYALLAPQNDFGTRVETALSAQTSLRGATIDAVRFVQRDPNAMMTPAKEVAAVLKAGPRGRQAVLLAERGSLPRALASLIPFNGVAPNRDVKLIGLSNWGDEDISKEPSLRGGWYVAADPTARAKFEESYQATFSRRPTRLSSIAYDATSLTARLAAARGRDGLSRRALESPNGFIGVDGLFRLRPDGGVERGLAIMEVGESAPKVVDPAPRTFVAPPVG
jgi:ABC-type branched-subunit amino acid transport system substrate-binding protein